MAVVDDGMTGEVKVGAEASRFSSSRRGDGPWVVAAGGMTCGAIGRRGPMMREDGGPVANPPPMLRMGAERPMPLLPLPPPLDDAGLVISARGIRH